ncbi:MAG: Gfo/Idh/MocA family oxidoreductase [Gemmatimonadales bacterium]|nr:Gfo/Idh/MocA family oxidoreductase [Gemmatimonadales bacterium]
MAVGLAFIGLKGHQSIVLDAIPDIPEVEILAVADDDPEALRRVPDFPGAKATTRTYLDYRELLESHKPDIIVEAGVDRERAGIITACAQRGIHVICEKPLAEDLAGLERVEKSILDAGLTCSALLTMRCEPPYLCMREAIAAGIVGEVTQGGGQKSYRLGARPNWQKSRETFSGIIPYIGIHVMDLFRWTTGREFVEVMAYASNVGHPDMGDLEDNACVIAKLDNGASAAFRLDYCRPAAAPTHGDDRLRVAGNRGVIEAKDGTVTAITKAEGPRELRLPPPVNFFADFIKAIQTDSEPFIPFADCVRITDVVLRARESAESRRPIKLASG